MTGGIDAQDPEIGRFDRSFLIQMIRDFFLILLLVAVLEFSLKAGLVVYDFAVNGREEVRERAEAVADNVRSIMLNSGGPVAARTVYPIIERNIEDLGYKVAVEPEPITVKAISKGFGFEPEGIPRDGWPEGWHRSATVEVEAQEFCLSCHTTASVGDVLGTVTVRTYLARDLALWWEDVKLGAGLAVGKIMLHSVLLFLLLRVRMEPLLRLRAVLGNLARAYGGLGHRAEIRTHDEFGALARDLNLFLERISGIVDELDHVLRRVIAVNDDIVAIQGNLRGQIDSLTGAMRQLERRAMLSAKREPMLSEEWFTEARRSVAGLDEALGTARATVPAEGEAARILEALTAVIGQAEAQIRTTEALFEELAGLGTQSERVQSALAEMARLEERLQAVVETGTGLVARLRPGASASGA